MALGADDSGESTVGKLQLPRGFRFHPTDEELVLYYLCPKAESQPFAVQIIADVDIYKFDPWNLPEKAVQGENEWYFFSPRDRKYPNGSRPNRAAGSGYWKATGTDKHISCAVDGGGSGHAKKMGVKKALVFYKGRPPNGTKTNWIMHEYRLTDGAGRTVVSSNAVRRRKGSLRLDDWVLCRIYKKRSSSDPTSAVINSKQEERADSSRRENMLEMDPEMSSSKMYKKRRLSSALANGMPLYLKQGEDWGKEVRRQDIDHLDMSSYVVEEFLASLPEIESSKLFINQLQVLLPKLEDNSAHADMQSIGSVVMDHIPIGEDDGSQIIN